MTIYLLIFAFILFLGVKIAPKGNFNEDFLSLKVSKGIQGFWAVCIIAHHFVQPFVYSGQGAGATHPLDRLGPECSDGRDRRHCRLDCPFHRAAG